MVPLPPAAGRLTEHWVSLFLDGRRATIQGLLERLPDAMLRSSAELAVLTAADRLTDGRQHDAAAYLGLARRLARPAGRERRSRFEVMLAIVELTLARARGDFAAAVDGAAAITAPANAVERAAVISNDDLRAVALMNLGIVELWARRVDDAERHLDEGLALARAIRRPYLELSCLGPLAEVAVVADRPHTAEARARAAIALADRHGLADGPMAGVAYSALGTVLLRGARIEESESWLERAERALKGLHDVEAAVVLRFRLGMLRFAQRRYEDAIEAFRDAEVAHAQIESPHYLAQPIRTWQVRAHVRRDDLEAARGALVEGDGACSESERRVLDAHLHLAARDPRAALRALADAHDRPPPELSGPHAIEVWLLEALAAEALGREEAARRALRAAVELTERNDHRWLFLTLPEVLPMLAQHRHDEAGASALCAELLERFAATRRMRRAPVPGSLTDRELAVLRLLPTNLSAGEIAGELLLSVHTVKSHMRNIYAKLAVHRRTDAVDAARRDGLLQAR